MHHCCFRQYQRSENLSLIHSFLRLFALSVFRQNLFENLQSHENLQMWSLQRHTSVYWRMRSRPSQLVYVYITFVRSRTQYLNIRLITNLMVKWRYIRRKISKTLFWLYRFSHQIRIQHDHIYIIVRLKKKFFEFFLIFLLWYAGATTVALRKCDRNISIDNVARGIFKIYIKLIH